MGKILLALAWLSIALSLPAPSAAAVYKWVDGNGVVTFKDSPPPAGVKAEIVVPQGAVSGAAADGNAGVETATAAAPNTKAPAFPPVEIYMTQWCPACKQAIAYLDALGVPYTKYDVDADRAAAERLSGVYYQRSIPFTVIGAEQLRGFSRQKFDAALGVTAP